MTMAEIDAVLERVKTWPPERQEAIASIALSMEVGDELYRLTPDDYAALDVAIAEADRGEFASEEQMAALLDRPA